MEKWRYTSCMIRTLAALFLLPFLAPADGISHFASLDGHKVHHVSYGSGDRAAVFIHGWTCDATFWQAQAPVYEKTRALLAARTQMKTMWERMAKTPRAQSLIGMFTPQSDPLMPERIELTMLAAPQYVATGNRRHGRIHGYRAERNIRQRAGPGDLLGRHFRLVDYVRFEGAGHFLMMEQPERFNGIPRKFLEEQKQ